MKTITYEEAVLHEVAGRWLMDLSTCPDCIKMDYETRNENVREGHTLCPRCDGTGNELFKMFKRCTQCHGKGYLVN